eukprot:TRINITY_DN7036_c0_g1_i1.p1 TRINITY_DN7036_c0_g1~~TRINITY_DN7036_c0_g1_i1.p1  ORF type:complete len:502 (+),score=134.97 TRINITY_DN7036_c0_g1_i1:53-1507(+)
MATPSPATPTPVPASAAVPIPSETPKEEFVEEASVPGAPVAPTSSSSPAASPSASSPLSSSPSPKAAVPGGNEWNTLVPSERERKIFVGGLSWMSTEESLTAYFKSLNEAVDRVVIMREKVTGRSRGFGFVIASSVEAMERIVSRPHVVDGKKIEAKKAIPKAEMNNPAKKVFVGGVALGVDDEQFRVYFSLFGAVAESQIIRDRLTTRSRGFGFVTFVNEDSVDKVLQQRHLIQGKEVEVKMAEPRKAQPLVRHVIQPVLVPAGYMGGGPYSNSEEMMYQGQRRRRLPGYHGRAKSGGPVYPPTYWPAQGYPMETDYRMIHPHQDPGLPLRSMPPQVHRRVHSEPRYLNQGPEGSPREHGEGPGNPADLDLTSLHISDISDLHYPDQDEDSNGGKQAYRRRDELPMQTGPYPPRFPGNRGPQPQYNEEDYASPFNHNGGPNVEGGEFQYSPQTSEWESIKGIFPPPPPPGQSYYIAPQLSGGW